MAVAGAQLREDSGAGASATGYGCLPRPAPPARNSWGSRPAAVEGRSQPGSRTLLFSERGWGEGPGEGRARSAFQGGVLGAGQEPQGPPTEARRGGTRGGLVQPSRQGELVKGQLAVWAALRPQPHPAPGHRTVPLLPQALPNPLLRGPRLPGGPTQGPRPVRLPLAQGSRHPSPGLLLPAPVPVAPAVHLVAGAAWTQHLRYSILPLRLQPSPCPPAPKSAYELCRPDITRGPPIPG